MSLPSQEVYDLFIWQDASALTPVNFLMRAPLKVIGQFLGLRKEAEARVIRETGNGAQCVLHLNGRDPHGYIGPMVVRKVDATTSIPY